MGTVRIPDRLRLGTRIYFLGGLLVVFGVYTQLAFGMEWSTEAGRIGPGFFPRIVGVLGLLFTSAVLVRELSRARAGAESSGESEAVVAEEDDDGSRYPMAVVYLMVAAAMFAYWFLLLGAVLSGALFLCAVLWFLDPLHRVRALVLGVAMPLGMYLLFQTVLNAGLPYGVLPLR